MTRIKAYQEHSIATQSKGRLIVLLYDGAVKFLRQALTETDRQAWDARARFLHKAAAIIDELDLCLDMDAGGDIAVNLRSLYGFVRRHLTQACARKDGEAIREVIRILEELNEGWKAITA